VFSIVCKVDTFKGTPLRSGRVRHLKRFVSKTCFFLLPTCVGHNSLCLWHPICLLSVGNSFKTCITSVGHGKALQLFLCSSCQIDRGHIKVPQNKFNMFSKIFFFKSVTRPDLSGVEFDDCHVRVCLFFVWPIQYTRRSIIYFNAVFNLYTSKRISSSYMECNTLHLFEENYNLYS